MGTGNNTQGNWVAGVSHPIIDVPNGSTFPSDYNIAYFPTIYMICQDKIIREVGQLNAAQLYAAGSSCPAALPNASVDVVAANPFPSPKYMCGNMLSPTLKFVNYSTTPLTSATLNIKYNGTTINSYQWSGNVAGNGIGTINVPQFSYNTATNYNGYSWEIVANGDVNPANNSKNLDWKVYTNSNAKSTDYAEPFSAATLPNNWTLPNGIAENYIFPFAGGVNGIPQVKGPDGAASQALLFDLLDIPGGANQALTGIVSNVDFSGKPYLTFDFDLAHANKTAQTNDKLEVLVSSDCGGTWNSVWNRSGATLNNDQGLYPATAPNNIFIPDAANDWQHVSINLDNYKSTQNLLIALRATALQANNGNALFVDNVKISGNTPASLTDNQFNQIVSLYPNPTNSNIFVKGLVGNASIQVLDVLGNIVYSNQYQNINGNIELPTSQLVNANYIIKITQEGKTAVKQFVKMD